MRWSAWLLIVFIAGGAWGVWWIFLRNPEQQNAFQARSIATRVLAEYVARKYPGHRALVVSNPFVENGQASGAIAEMENAGIVGIKKGLAGGATLEGIVYPALKPEAQADPRSVPIDSNTTTPLSYLVAESAFDQLATTYPQCDVIISLIGVPADLEQVNSWQHPGKPAFALLLPDLRFIGAAAEVKQAVESGKLAAFVLNKPRSVDSRAPVSGDHQAEFEKRFLLVTRENLDDVLQTYPQLFRL